jgi:hypothetical protein
MHGGDTAPLFAAVLDIVVHQKGVVQHLDGRIARPDAVSQGMYCLLGHDPNN